MCLIFFPIHVFGGRLRCFDVSLSLMCVEKILLAVWCVGQFHHVDAFFTACIGVFGVDVFDACFVLEQAIWCLIMQTPLRTRQIIKHVKYPPNTSNISNVRHCTDTVNIKHIETH